MGQEVLQQIQNLLQSIDTTLKKLLDMPDKLLDEKSEHPCSMGGTVRDLLMHNIDHERMHAGSVLTARYELKCLQNSQEGEATRILAEWFRERAALVGALMGLLRISSILRGEKVNTRSESMFYTRSTGNRTL